MGNTRWYFKQHRNNSSSGKSQILGVCMSKFICAQITKTWWVCKQCFHDIRPVETMYKFKEWEYYLASPGTDVCPHLMYMDSGNDGGLDSSSEALWREPLNGPDGFGRVPALFVGDSGPLSISSGHPGTEQTEWERMRSLDSHSPVS